ncbi:MAG: amidase [Gemmatimonadaceae bacterium]|nr:amidase [Gemmatimonadaceae bacterium]
MDRRNFVRNAALTAAVVAGVKPAAAKAAAAKSAPRDPKAEAIMPLPAFALEEKTIDDLQRMMATGAMSSKQITQAYLSRIEALNKRGPALHAVIETNPDAIAIASALDAERNSKGARGPLHGIPILLKDNIDTHDRMTTTAGSYALEGSIPLQDAFIAAKLRAAGAVLLGKTNLSEWANFRSSHASSGWSGRGGQTKNPYVLDRNPCGSSSGSGAGVAANLCAGAVGSETDGSIVCPSSANGIVGIKPTLGLLSRSGIIPIAHSQDTAGPMTRTVRDAAIMLGVMAGEDATDSATAGSSAHAATDYTKFLDPKGLRGARIGVVRAKYSGFNDDVDRLVSGAIDAMKRGGAVIVDPADIPTAGKFDDSEFDVLLYEFKADLNKYLSSLGPKAPVKMLKDIIAFNEKHRDKEMPWFGQDIMIKAEAKGPLTEKKYLEALAQDVEMSRAKGIDAVMNEHKLDALIAPTGGPAWPIDLLNGDHYTGGYSTPSAVAGYPNINVPIGFVSGLPIGMSIFGRRWSEPTLLRIAYSYEQATKMRRVPKFIPTLGV